MDDRTAKQEQLGEPSESAVMHSAFQQELAEARDWYEKLQQNEVTWIREGQNPEQEFDRLYDQAPQLSPSPEDPITASRDYLVYAIYGTVGLALLSLLLFILKRRMRSRNIQRKDSNAINSTALA